MEQARLQTPAAHTQQWARPRTTQLLGPRVKDVGETDLHALSFPELRDVAAAGTAQAAGAAHSRQSP